MLSRAHVWFRSTYRDLRRQNFITTRKRLTRNSAMTNTKPADSDVQPQTAQPAHDSSRRNFLSFGLAVLAGSTFASLIPTLLFPSREAITTGLGEFLSVGAYERMAKHAPMRIEIRTNRRDAWNRQDNVLIGSAWIVRQGENLLAFSAACPHLGCGVDYDEARASFVCQCHKSYFAIDGSVLEGPSPRGLDQLETRKQEGLLQLRFERFKYGKKEKERV
jgi:Rieske Fe-S protein